jgi:succinoglycan biosynthesis transport protein ExoP
MKHDDTKVPQFFRAAGRAAPVEHETDSQSQLSDLIADVITAIRRSFLYIALISLVAFALSLLLASQMTAKYEALGRLVIDQSLGTTDVTSRSSNIFGETMMIDSEVESLVSRDLLNKVAERLGAQNVDATFAISAESTHEERGEAIDTLLEGLSVERVDSTFVIDVRFEAETPELAAMVVNLLMEEFRLWRQSVLMTYMDEASVILGSQIAASDAEVADAERRVEEFKTQFENHSAASASVLEAKLGETAEDLFRTESILQRLDGEVAAVRTALSDPTAITDDIIEALPADIAPVIGRAAAELRQLAASGEVTARSQTLTSQIESQLRREETSIEARRSAVLPTVTALRIERENLNREFAGYRTYLVDLRGLERQAEALAARHVALLNQLQNTRQETNLVLNPARILQTAAPPLEPTGLGPKTLIVIATLAGLLASLAFALIREQIDGSFRNSQQLCAATRTNYFGSFPTIPSAMLRRAPAVPGTYANRLSRKERKLLSLSSFAIRQPGSRAAKAIGRSTFGIETECERPAIISVISALGGEGKSVVSSNLGFALSAQGYRVLLVDGDRRNRGLSSALGPAAKQKKTEFGIHFAACDAEFRKLTTDLDLIYTREGTLGSASWLTKLVKLLQSSEDDAYDYVIIDTPPLAFMPEAINFVSESDASIMVVKWGSTRMSLVRRLLAQNPGIRNGLIGAIFCQTDPKLQDRYEYLPDGHGYYDDA